MLALMKAWIWGAVVAWNSCEPDASRQGIEVLSSKSLWFLRLSGGVIDDLDGTDDDHLAGLGDLEEAVIGAERHLGLVDLDDAFQWFALRVHHRPPQFLRQQPSRAVGEPKLPLQLLRRHAVGVGGHQGERPRTILSATTLSGASPSQPSPMSVDRRRHTHGYKLGLFSRQDRVPPHSGQPKPSGQRRSNRNRAHSLHPESAVEIRGARAASWPWRRIMTARPPRIQRNMGQRDKPYSTQIVPSL